MPLRDTYLLLGALLMAGLVTTTSARASETVTPPQSLEELGELLFHDVNLSADRTQSCATCHDPEHGFADPRGMASIGDDGVSIGDRNAPTASYAAFSPRFHLDEDGTYRGGQFWDGRAATLADQAGGPPLNIIEMRMRTKEDVVDRLLENPVYAEGFPALFGAHVFDTPDAAYDAMTHAIAAFEKTDLLSPFSSKYDRFLRGEAELTDDEELGRLLFFSEQFTNCNQCHQLGRSQMDPKETFTDYRYHNVGVPENTALRALNGVAPGTPDPGLAGNPEVDRPGQEGKFRTPTLRNVAVTGPYMHNGVFSDLRTVVKFYNRYNSKADSAQINPETGAPYGPIPFEETLAVEELTHGPALDDRRIDALVAFLKALTDERYEHLLTE